MTGYGGAGESGRLRLSGAAGPATLLHCEPGRPRKSASGRGCAERQRNWKRFGPYLSERQWGTVREDYSREGTCWDYFPHDHARSRAYRWGEDGLLGLCDRQGRLCFALALWNGQDRILKERLFGLTGPEGNHGEDVKELYYYLDSTPTHSYCKGLYKYPQRAFPYAALVEENRRRGKRDPEFELADTGVFDDDRYFDVFVEYAKADPEDMLIRITVDNRGPEAAPLHVLPTLWFRNTWSWGRQRRRLRAESRRAEPESATTRSLRRAPRISGYAIVLRCDASDGPGALAVHRERDQPPACCSASPMRRDYVKDAFHDYVVHGRHDRGQPGRPGHQGRGADQSCRCPPVVSRCCACA